jgi:hypothetical protein
MPTVSEDELKSRYEYLPEESISESDLLNIISSINDPDMEQVLDPQTLQCSGACPL